MHSLYYIQTQESQGNHLRLAGPKTESLARYSRILSPQEWLRLLRVSTITFRRQLWLLRWLIPVSLALVVVSYELIISRWTFQQWGFSNHLIVEISVFGTMGPLLAFVLLELLGKWIEEKETADLQSPLLAKANEKEQIGRQINDTTIQVLFGTSLLMSKIKVEGSNLPAETIRQIERTESALNESMELLRTHLLN